MAAFDQFGYAWRTRAAEPATCGGGHRGAGGLAVAQVLFFTLGAGGVALGQDVDAGGGDVGEQGQADARAAAAKSDNLVWRVAKLEGHGVKHDAGCGVSSVGVDNRLAVRMADEN